MVNRFRASSMIFALLTAIVPLSAAQSHAIDVAVDQTPMNVCSSGEAVALTGNLQIQYSVAPDPSGGNHFDFSMGSSYSGVGGISQGNYMGGGWYGYAFTTTDSPVQFTLELATPLKASGSATSLTLNQAVNITVDTDGNISASVPSSSTTCASN